MIPEIFKRRRDIGREDKSAAGTEVFFMADFDGEGRPVLRVVDSSLKDIDADCRQYEGDTFLMLRNIDAIKEAGAMTFSWLGAGKGIYLDEHPQLVWQLIRCRNFINDKGERLEEMPGLYQMDADVVSEGRWLKPEFSLRRIDGDGPFRLGDFRLLTDCFAISGVSVVALKPLGSDFAKLDLMRQKFDETVAEQFLSVLMSRFDNISLSFGGVPCRTSGTPMKASSAIVFEKVNEDNALFMRQTEGIPGVPVGFVEDFSPVRIVSLHPEPVIRNVDYSGVRTSETDLYKRVASCAPDRKTAKEIYCEDNLFIIPEQIAGPFLLRNLSGLAEDYMLIGSDRLSGYRIRAVAPKFSLSGGSSGIDFLEGSAEIHIDNDVFSLSDFLAQYRRNRYVELSDGEKGIVDDAYVKRLERIYSSCGKGKKLKLSFFDMPEVAALMEQVPDAGLFRKSREFYSGFNSLAASEDLNIKGLKAKLRPYQQNGVKWLKYLYDNNLGGCLADDMGLGKTVQAISLLLLSDSIGKKKGKPSLIVMPRTLLFNWTSEFAKFAPQVKISTYYGAERNLEQVADAKVIFTTYALLRNDVEKLSRIKFDTVILDESQNIKNMTAKASQAVMLLDAEHRFALSGTPLENRIGELYPLFRFLNPGMFGSAENFNSRYAQPIQKDGDAEVMRELKARISPFILRRLKTEVLDDLPERIDQTMYVEMEPDHRQFYELRRRQYYESIKNRIRSEGVAKSQFEMLQALGELRRIASIPESISDGRIHSSKIPMLADAVLEAAENGHKVVVFFNFIAGIELLAETLEANAVGYAVMTGATGDRQRVVERFQNDAECRVMLMTLKTGGVGLNLTAADTVFVAEPWWNKSAEEQAIGRLHRIGQKSVVHSFSVITTGTIEEKIQQLQQQKSSLVASLISSDSSTAKVLSEEDIDFILG